MFVSELGMTGMLKVGKFSWDIFLDGNCYKDVRNEE